MVKFDNDRDRRPLHGAVQLAPVGIFAPIQYRAGAGVIVVNDTSVWLFRIFRQRRAVEG